MDSADTANIVDIANIPDIRDNADSADRVARLTDAMRRIVMNRAKEGGLTITRRNTLRHWGRRIGTHLIVVVPPLIEAGHLVPERVETDKTLLHLSDSGSALLRGIDERRYS